MGSDAHPSLIGTLFTALCFLPWVILAISAYRDKQPRPKDRTPKTWREIKPREMSDADERAAFVQTKLEKIERASR